MQARYLSIVLFLLLPLSMGQNSSVQPSGAIGLPPPTYQTDFAAVVADGQHAVSWDKGYLLSFGLGATKQPIALYDRTDKWLFESPLAFEGAIRTYVHDAAPTSGGKAVVAAGAVTSDGATADLVVEMGKEGASRVIRTSPFYPIKICSTEEGVAWVYGKELSEDRKLEPRERYPMLREYRFDKGQLRSEVDRLTIRPAKGIPLDGANRDDLQMKCNSSKVVLINYPNNELIEYDLLTSKVSRWPMSALPEGFRMNGSALTDSGEVYVSALRGGNGALTGMFRLRVNTSGVAEWVPLTVSPAGDKFFVLVGSDGENLVYSRGLLSPTLFWSKPPRIEVMK